MVEMLTAKEMQALLQVDRSTIYRMAEAGRLPAIKVGKQWRFPADTIEQWLKSQSSGESVGAQQQFQSLDSDDTAALLPLDCVQLIQDAFAEILGVTLLVTDLEGNPITQASNPGPIHYLLEKSEDCYATWHDKWKEVGQIPALEPRFKSGPGGLMCARALVRIENELRAMVITYGLAPVGWQPDEEAIGELVRAFNVPVDKVRAVLTEVPALDDEEQKKVLVAVQRIADVLAHIGDERMQLLNRLTSISNLSAIH